MLERNIEEYLVKRVKAMGGEVRKVKWIGRNSAPDRLVMLPGNGVFNNTTWVELKRPGLAAGFPADAHERAQDREHQRMRRMGQRVVVIDSLKAVEELLDA